MKILLFTHTNFFVLLNTPLTTTVAFHISQCCPKTVANFLFF